METNQHPAHADRLTVPITASKSAEEAAEKKAFWIAIFIAVGLIVIWAGATAIFGLIGYILVSVALVPLVFVVMIKLTLG